MRDRGRLRALQLALLLLVLIAFAPAARNGFVLFDDTHLVSRNPVVARGLTAAGVRWAFTATERANWMPLTRLAHLANWELFGSWAGGHHLASVLLHAFAAAVLLAALLRATGALWPSAFAAGVFALHPLRVESVAWASELKDVLAGLFFMVALHLHVRRAQSGSRRDAGLLLAAAGCGLLAKPMVVTLPVVLLIADAWPLGRAGLGWRRLVREKAPLLALAAAAALATILIQRPAAATLAVLPPAERLLNATRSAALYLRKLAWPADLSPFYPLPDPGALRPGAFAAAALLAALTALALRARRTRPWLAAGGLWYLAMLLPVAGIIQVGLQSLADRYTYLPLLGVVLAATWELRDRLAGAAAGRGLLAAAGGACVGACLLMTPLQTARWRDTRTLFTHALRQDPANWLAHLKLGEIAREEGALGEALPALERAAALAPGNFYARTLLGVTYGELGRPAEALRELDEAVRIEPGWEEARHALAVTLANLGRVEEAITQAREELALSPRSPRPRRLLVPLLLAAGRLDEAERACREWLRLEPDAREARALLERIRAARSGPPGG